MMRYLQKTITLVFVFLVVSLVARPPIPAQESNERSDTFYKRAHPLVYKLLSQIPAADKTTRDSLNARLMESGKEGLATIAAMVLPSGIGNDSLARFALGELAHYASRPGASNEQVMLESVLLNALQTTEDWEVQAFFIRCLENVGGEESIPVLGRYLNIPRLYQPAIKTLSTLSHPEAETALLNGLRQAGDNQRIPYINALGGLRSKKAANEIMQYATSDYPALQLAALQALANIGEPAAAAPLKQAMETKNAYRRSQFAVSYLLLGSRLGENGNQEQALVIFSDILDNQTKPEDDNLQARALSGLVRVKGKQANQNLLQAMSNESKKVRMAALKLARDLRGEEITHQWIRKLDAVDAPKRVEILYMLGERSDTVALSGVLDQLNSSDVEVRLAAMQSSVKLDGSQAASSLLSRLAQTSNPDEIDAIQTALSQIPRKELLPKIADRIGEIPNQGKITLLDILGQRQAADYKGTVFHYAEEGTEEVRGQAITTLRYVASSEDIPDIIDLMLNTKITSLRNTAQQTAVHLARTPSGSKVELEPFRQRLASVSAQQQVYLIQAIGQLESEKAMRVVVKYVDNPNSEVSDAAIRALLKWQSVDVIPALIDIAESAGSLTHTVLAIRGAQRIVTQSDLSTEAKIQRYETLMNLAPRAEEKRMIISGLGRADDPEAIDLIVQYLDDEDVQSAAAIAIVNYAGRIEDARGMTVASQITRALLEPCVNQKTADRIREIVQEQAPTGLQKEFTTATGSKISFPSSEYEAGSAEVLFNKKNLSGWEGMVADGNPLKQRKMTDQELAKAKVEANRLIHQHWSAQNGVLQFDGVGYHSIRTTEEYRNFELYVDWKILPGGDSGIYLREVPQVQIWDVTEHPEGSGGLYNNKNHPSEPLRAADNPPGEWNTFRIKMVEEKVTVWLNGIMVVDNVPLENYWERGKPLHEEGPICLQAHDTEVSFRNIFLRELPDKSELYSGLLFNEKDLSGWEAVGADISTWGVEDGILYTTGEGGGWLCTDKTYSDFILSLEFRLPEEGNSGIFLRAPRKGNPAYAGMEVQVLDDYADKYRTLEPWQYTGSVDKVQAPSKRVTKPAGQWNKYKILCDGPVVKVWSNGHLINDVNLIQHMNKSDTHPGLKRRKGYIGLQNHSTRVEYRNIKIKELK